MKIIPSFSENGPPFPILEMDLLVTGWLVRRMPQRTRWEMVGLWNDWKKWCEYFENNGFSSYTQNRIMKKGTRILLMETFTLFL